MNTLLLLAALNIVDRSWTIYYQKDCLACRRQLKEMDCLAAKGWKVAVIGVGDDHSVLKHELKRQTRLPLSPSFMTWPEARAQGIPGTPTNVITDDSGTKLRAGFIPCSAVS